MSKANIFIVSGPSGSGKDTILQEVFKQRPELFFSISSITRAMRPGEKEGEKYHFVSKQAFENGLAQGAFLEHNCYVGNYYGTPKAPVLAAVEQGRDAVIEVDVNGAAQIRQKLPECVSIFIMPPSFSVLKNRLRGRNTESEAQITERLNAALREIERAGEFDYIVVNDALEKAVTDFITVIESSRLQYKNQKNIIDEVLKKC